MYDKDEKLDKYVQAAAEARIMDALICMIHDDFSEIISGAKCNKFLDKSGKALDKIKDKADISFLDAFPGIGSDTSLLWTHLFHGILYAPPRDKYDSLAMERAKEIMKDMIHRIDEYQQRMVLK